jgi:hypothetical protein
MKQAPPALSKLRAVFDKGLKGGACFITSKPGFLTNIAWRLAEKLGKNEAAMLLSAEEAAFERSSLVREETLCNDSLTQAERRWLKSNRSNEARHWNRLTDLSPEHLSHAV